MRAALCGLCSSALSIAAVILACGDLPGARTKNRCIEQGDCNPGYGCVENVCRRWVDVPGVVSTEPFTGTGSFLTNLVASGSYQVVLQYDADTPGVAIRTTFGRDDPSRPSEQGAGKRFASGSFDNAPGAYVLRVEAGPGVTVHQVSVSPCPEEPPVSTSNCGQCGHVCLAPPGLTSPPVCVAGVCEWSGGIQEFLDHVNVRPAPNTENDPIAQVPKGEEVFFDCQVVGELISQAGISKTSAIWDHVPAYGGYVADLLLVTGRDDLFAPACP